VSVFPQNYKIRNQRVWPYPNTIHTKGRDELIISRRLRPRDIKGPGASRLESIIIDEFNDFVFFDAAPNAGAVKTTYSIDIQSKDSLSTPNLDESYTLSVSLEGAIMIAAKSYVGAVHALTTLSQLIRRQEKGIYSIQNSPLQISDIPGVSHREVMLDCSRHYLPVSLIHKQIRAMAFQKLNILHLHLTDGQSFSLNLDPYAEDKKDDYIPLKSGESYTSQISLGKDFLAFDNMGAYSDREVYTSHDIEDIIDYAKAYGIIVLPEIDTPGHTYSWMYGFAEIMTCNSDANQTDACCPEPPCGFFNLKEKMSQVQNVVIGVFSEVIKAFKLGQEGYGSYFHLGFDEVGCPIKDPKTGACIAPSCDQAYGTHSVNYLNWLFSWFSKTHASLTTILWIDQILASNFDSSGHYTAQIKADRAKVILQFWTLDDQNTVNNIKYMAEKEGFRLLNSQATTYYLDSGGQGNSFYTGGPIMAQAKDKINIEYQKNWITAYPGVAPCTDANCVALNKGWQVSFEDIYLNNLTLLPTNTRGALVDGKIGYEKICLDAGSGGIIGGAVALWGEQIDATNLEQKLWPKASAFAESLWKFDANRLPDNIINAKYRLIFAREDLLRLAISASPLVPGDVFRSAPWGPLNSKTTDLMHDVNDLNNPQIPEGYVFSYWSHWNVGSYCKSDTIDPINPFCGSALSKYMTCDGKNSTKYIQPTCKHIK
jgi:hexosaminidase